MFCLLSQLVFIHLRPLATENALKIQETTLPGFWNIYDVGTDWFSLKLVSMNSTYQIFYNGVEHLRAIQFNTWTFTDLELWLSGPNMISAMGFYRNLLLTSC